MTIDTTSSSFMENYTYATKKYHYVMEKYLGYFKGLFRLDLATFFYEKWYVSGEYFSVNSSQSLQELFMEMQGSEDSPFCTEFSKFRSQNTFAYKNQNINNLKHNKFRCVLEQQNINQTFFITEKYPSYCQVIGWDLFTPKNQLSIIESQNVVLQDCANNARAIKACFDQFKKEMFRVIENKGLYRVNLKDIKKDNYETQEFITNDSNNEVRKALLNAGIIEERDIILEHIKFTSSERQVLDCYLQGMSAKEIGKIINRSYKTVEEHINIIKAKLNVKKKRCFCISK